MMYRAISLFICSLLLFGCGEDEPPLLGTWQGTISDEQRQVLDIKEAINGDQLIVTFGPKTVLINGQSIKVAYAKVEDAYFANQLKSNMTLTGRFLSPTEIILSIPNHYRNGILRFQMKRVDKSKS